MFRKFLAGLMSFCLLVATTGVVLVTHTCLASSDKKTSLFQTPDCCPDEPVPCGQGNGDAHLVAKCCVTDYSYHQTGTLSFPVEKVLRIQPVLIPSSLFSVSPTCLTLSTCLLR